MQIAQSLKHFVSKLLHSVLRQLLVLLKQALKVATNAMLEDDPEMVPRLVPIVELQNVWVPIAEGATRAAGICRSS